MPGPTSKRSSSSSAGRTLRPTSAPAASTSTARSPASTPASSTNGFFAIGTGPSPADARHSQMRVVPAGDGEQLAGHVAALLRDEEEHRVGDVVGHVEATERWGNMPVALELFRREINVHRPLGESG